MKINVLMFFGFVAGGAASAQDIDCANAMTQFDMNQCAALEYQAADEDLNWTYQMIMDDLKERNPAMAEALRDAQRKWIPYRDAACKVEAMQYEGGSMQPLVHVSCLAGLTRQRDEDIRMAFESN